MAIVNLGILLKYGMYGAANKLANGRNIAALDEAWDVYKSKPKIPPKSKTKPINKEASKGGPGVNRPIDEFDDTAIYQGAGKSRPEPPHATGGKVEGTGKGKYLTDPAEMRPYIIPPRDGFDAFLERKYIEIRKIGLEDISIVAKNTGLTEQEISDMKKHLFLDTHQLSIDGVPYKELYFRADQDIAYAWQLAQKKELTVEERDWFRQLANHELKEKELMDKGMPLMDLSTWNPKTERFDPDPGKNAHDKANVTDPNPGEFPKYNANKDYWDHSDTDSNNY
ncbi:hypothetical protein ASF12_33100 [Paenibacillus sp. Leaf72]|nr:hypothetical protein ASF12_33100 [Paenibacillus sp. Leaf72]